MRYAYGAVTLIAVLSLVSGAEVTDFGDQTTPAKRNPAHAGMLERGPGGSRHEWVRRPPMNARR